MDQATSVRCVRLLPEQPGTTALIQSRDACRAVQRGLLAARISGDGERRLCGIPPPLCKWPLRREHRSGVLVGAIARGARLRTQRFVTCIKDTTHLRRLHRRPPADHFPLELGEHAWQLDLHSAQLARWWMFRAGSRSLLRTPAGDSRHGTAPSSSGASRRSTARRIRSSRSRRTGSGRHESVSTRSSRHSARPTRSLPFSAAISRTRHDHARGGRHRIGTIRYADGRAVTAATACDTTHIPRSQNEKPLDPSGSRGFVFWRRGWDSNPRYGETVRLISSQVHSTTLPPLLPCCFTAFRGWSFPRKRRL